MTLRCGLEGSLPRHRLGVQRAKRLLDLTELPMTEVALQAGFRSLRRFNAVFVEVYRRSPTQVRTFARANGWGSQVARSEYSPSSRLSIC